MRYLADFLAAHPAIDLILTDEQAISSSDILERASELGQAISSRKTCRVFSLDQSPATLLALLIIAERRPYSLVLCRPSMNISALGGAFRPDIVVHSTGQVEEHSQNERIADEAIPGIFLLTSGTTGTPKIVHQTLPALLGKVRNSSLDKNYGARWLLTYETHSFAGIQVILSAALSGGTLVVPSARNPIAMAEAARAQAVTHISGTPTFWRALLIAVKDRRLPALRQITLGGEAIDQQTLSRLSKTFPGARISHIYASTEAGALFTVHDGRAGFPREQLEKELPGGVMLRIRNGILEVRSPRRMVSYASGQDTPLSEDGWLVTGDLVRVEADRVVFCGRQDQIVNIAGLKVSPEEVEAFLLAQPMVAEAQVYAVPSPLTGALLAARIVMQSGLDSRTALDTLRAACIAGLPRHMVPRHFEIVDAIAMSNSGKKVHTP